MTVLTGRLPSAIERERIEAAKRKPRPPSRVARLLALGHWIEDAVTDGRIESYAAVARRLGMSERRVAQIVDLTLLAPRIQEDLLLGRVRCTAREVERLMRGPRWGRQVEGFGRE